MGIWLSRSMELLIVSKTAETESSNIADVYSYCQAEPCIAAHNFTTDSETYNTVVCVLLARQ